MKNTIIRTAAITALAAFALAGCGTLTEEPVAAPTVEETTEEQAEPSDEGGEPVSAPQINAEEEQEAETEEMSTEGGQGVYQGENYDGAVVTVAVPGEAPADVVDFQERTGTEGVGYLVAEVDNTQGNSETFVFEIQVVDTDGKTYTYKDLSSATYDWNVSYSDAGLMEEELALWEKYPYATAPTAKNTIPLAGPEVPENVATVIVDGSRIERVGDL